MKEKNILGLDLGTNSIGWAIIKETNDNNTGECNKIIADAGSRIIPMDADTQGKFAKGETVSQTCERTNYRGVRRLRERQLLRRERLHRVLSLMGFLPQHYANALTRYGKFKANTEVRLPWDNSTDGFPRFIFMQAYEEMLRLFWTAQPELMRNNMKVPYDWTIYYLRKKALQEPITGQELAWILLNFNQKRGYYQTRGEEASEDKTKIEEYFSLKVVDVVDTGEKKGKDTWFDVLFENGMVYHRSASQKPEWIGQIKEFIVTTHLNPDGTPKKDKDGNDKQSIRMPKDDDWGLQKLKTEHDINQSELTVGEYIFNALLNNPKQKIIGGLVRVVERDMYRDELRKILEKQAEFIPELSNEQLYADCIAELYPQNEAYRLSIAKRGFTYLLLDNIIFYQRPLKSKKSLIDECPYEYHEYTDEDGETKKKYVKCISKSHPLYQEFRLWQFISNLKLYKVEKDDDGREIDKDVTGEFLPDEESRANLFDYLNNITNIKQDDLLTKYFNITKPKGKKEQFPYHWNYVQDKQYPCNTTRGEIISRLKKAKIDTSFLDEDTELHLWHILYSVSDRTELQKALASFAKRYGVSSDFADVMAKFPPFDSAYGAYSAKAIKRLLPLMRIGHHWRQEDIDEQTLCRINHIINGEADDGISERTREKTSGFTNINQFRGLPLWIACYVVYDRHSEASDIMHWHSPADIDNYLSTFRQHSLRNPIVVQIITETLRTVRDVWRKHKHIDEIHIEMGRDLKNPADKRRKDTERMLKNENANLRIKALLTEFLNPDLGIENVRPYSPSQQEILRIYEDTALNSVDEKERDSDINDILKKFTDAKNRPTPSEVKRYKLWLEQHYLSPYTGQPIPMSRLFTSDYEIEHIIPQSRYFDDSMTNKVICESEVNKLKNNALGFEFIKQHHGETVELSGGRKAVRILEVDSYCELVEKTYNNNRAKKRKLLMEDIPSEFIERQLNDSRYISKVVKTLLSSIVREDGEQEATSKNVIVCNGSVTDRLKKDWGINDIWNHIILPRFVRMNELTDSQLFTSTSTNGHLIPSMPLELQKGFNKKRIDHRHHAMDAIVIACTTRDHVNLLSNEAASPKSNINRQQLSHKLRRYEDTVINNGNGPKRLSVAKEFMLPWQSFPSDVEQALQDIIVSFKQNLRIINKTSNHYTRFIDGKKKVAQQTSGDSWAIRKSMHKDTFWGEINLRLIKTVSLKAAMSKPQNIVNCKLREEIKRLISLGLDEKKIKKFFEANADSWQDVNIQKIEVYYFSKESSDRFYATRKNIGSIFEGNDIKKIEKKIAKIVDTGIQEIMRRHLRRYNNNPNLAFSPEGIEEMNKHIVELNYGRFHQPIYRVRVYEKSESKYTVGQTGIKNKQFVEADDNTNLFFAIREENKKDKNTGEITKKRKYETIPLYVAIERMKQGLPIDEEATFILSPNDLVYLPTAEEYKSGNISLPLNKERIYKMVDASSTTVNFVPHSVANVLFSVKKEDSIHYNDIQNELGCGNALSKNARAITGEMIKEKCIPIKVDRLGNITKIGV